MNREELREKIAGIVYGARMEVLNGVNSGFDNDNDAGITSDNNISDKILALIPDTSQIEQNRAEQLALNCRWLIEKIDIIHSCLCPGQNGTWQQRAEQAVIAAQQTEGRK
jgi:hypothetical protein